MSTQTLKEFIEETGDEESARLFGVAVRTAASWRRGERFPRPAKAPSIVAATKNRVTFEGIYQSQDSRHAA